MVSNANDFRGVFGEVLDTVKDTFGNLLQLLTNLKNKEIEFDFHKKINYGLPFGIIFITSNSDNPIDIDNKTKKLESCFRDAIKHPFYCPFTIEDYLILDNLKSCFVFQNKPRVDSEQNRKINEIVEGLKSGKIIGKKIISNAFDLKKRLFIDIINVINQKKRVALNHAQIDDIQYNVLDSAFYFIFDVGNPSHLAIKVPRKSLENDLHLIDD
ncbi:hypothetical protein [Helicobacter pylori]|uniref:hypothetical protein n=1 Tax=Helicobacter pylori TaxID=210 RepID=UPI0012B1C076|nr:hypothetical protein [Helicobacter pylori]